MRQVRKGVFETNSSMTHSLVVCKDDKYSEWVDGKVMFKFSGEQFLETSEALKENAKQLRETLKWYEENGRDYNRDKFNEHVIERYENGEIKENWAVFSRWDIDSYYITFEQFCDYVRMEGYERVGESSNVDGIKMTVFGYYGHD